MYRHLILSSALAVGVLGLAACSGTGAGIPSAAQPDGVASRPVFPNAGATNVIQNPEFANGKLAPWVAVGPSSGEGEISTKEHYGATKYSAFMGTTAPPAINGVGGISQKVKVPTKGELTWWYYGKTDDQIKYAHDVVEVTEGKITTAVSTLFVTSGKWTEGSVSLAKYAGKTVTLTFAVSDNGYDKTYIEEYVDDISLVAGK
jgi:hypothetical protein